MQRRPWERKELKLRQEKKKKNHLKAKMPRRKEKNESLFILRLLLKGVGLTLSCVSTTKTNKTFIEV